MPVASALVGADEDELPSAHYPTAPIARSRFTPFTAWRALLSAVVRILRDVVKMSLLDLLNAKLSNVKSFAVIVDMRRIVYEPF